MSYLRFPLLTQGIFVINCSLVLRLSCISHGILVCAGNIPFVMCYIWPTFMVFLEVFFQQIKVLLSIPYRCVCLVLPIITTRCQARLFFRQQQHRLFGEACYKLLSAAVDSMEKPAISGHSVNQKCIYIIYIG